MHRQVHIEGRNPLSAGSFSDSLEKEENMALTRTSSQSPISGEFFRLLRSDERIEITVIVAIPYQRGVFPTNGR